MSEHDEQAALIDWAGWNAGRWPVLSLIYAVPNGGLRHKATAGRLKATGSRAGVPDLHLPVARGPYHSLYLEMKTLTGRCSTAQVEFQRALERQGHRVVVARGWTAAKDALLEYLALDQEAA